MGLDNLSEYALKCPLIDLVHGDCCCTYTLYMQSGYCCYTKSICVTLKNPVEVVFDKGNYIFQELHGAYAAVTYTMCIPK